MDQELKSKELNAIQRERGHEPFEKQYSNSIAPELTIRHCDLNFSEALLRMKQGWGICRPNMFGYIYLAKGPLITFVTSDNKVQQAPVGDAVFIWHMPNQPARLILFSSEDIMAEDWQLIKI